MNENFWFNKVFLTSGCSYTTRLEYIKEELDIIDSPNDDKTLIHHIGLASSSIQHLKNSIISFVDYFLKNGINRENIYVVGNLTQIGRRSYKFNKNENKYILKLINEVVEFKEDNSLPDFNFKKYPLGFCELDDDIYSSLIVNTELYNPLPNDIKKGIFTFMDYHNKLTMEELVENYFTDLIIIQEYLKKNKIEYTFYFMNNIIEGWNATYSTHLYNNFYGKFEVPDLTNTHNIKNISSKVNSLFNLIDFDNIVCYSTEKQKYGGMDEYAIDNFKPTDFAGLETLEIKDYYGPQFTFFGKHPLENVQIKFEEKFIHPKMESFIKKHYKNII